MTWSKRINFSVLVLVLVLGVVTPFVPAIHTVIAFYLLFPLLIGFLLSLLGLSVYLFMHGRNFFNANTFSMPLIIPVFVICAIVSGPLVGKVQRYRCERIIENIDSANGMIPDSLDVKYGVKYQKLKDESFLLEYSRGFFVREVYSSTDSTWESYGWRD